MKFLILFLYLVTINISYAIDQPNFKNIVINQAPKSYEDIVFKDLSNKDVNLKNFENKLVFINFWATWCVPCVEEMPSLDSLQSNEELNNLVILPVNIGQEDLDKIKNFFYKLEIKNLDIYFDPGVNLVKKFSIRGVPTTILINKEGKEFGRILGSIDFNDKEFVNWVKNYN